MFNITVARGDATKNLISVRGIVTVENALLVLGKVLRTERRFELVGGTVEIGETPRLALRNEVLEETGHHVAEVGSMVYETDFVKKKTREDAWLGVFEVMLRDGDRVRLADIVLNPEEHDAKKLVSPDLKLPRFGVERHDLDEKSEAAILSYWSSLHPEVRAAARQRA